MTVQDVAGLEGITTVHMEDPGKAVKSVFCGDLLSIVMARAPEGCAWVTVIGNANVVAVAELAGISCIIQAEGYSYDEAAAKAAQGRVTLFSSSLPVYETAALIGSKL